MNPKEVVLFSYGEKDACWIEIQIGGTQVGADVECRSRRAGLSMARRLCVKHMLFAFVERRSHYLKGQG